MKLTLLYQLKQIAAPVTAGADPSRPSLPGTGRWRSSAAYVVPEPSRGRLAGSVPRPVTSHC